jgi:PAS domain S-box-containing protein
MKILYVEDDPKDADLARRALAKSAPEIALDIVGTYQEAVARLEKVTDYDLILTNLRLPDGGGLSLLMHIRALSLPCAVVVISGKGDEETAVAALKSGADDYVVKHKDYLKILPITLENALQRHRAELDLHAWPLRVLYGEHHAADIDLTRRHLAQYAPFIQMKVINTPPEITQRLSDQKVGEKYDVILLDYSLPGLNTLDLIKDFVQVRGVDVPIVVVTGQGAEDVAAQAIKLGAADYVVKNPGYLFQLPGVLENAFHRIQLRREQAALRESEHKFRGLVEQSSEGIVIVDEQGMIVDWNYGQEQISGVKRADVLGLHMWDVQFQMVPDEMKTPAMRERLEKNILGLLSTGQSPRLEQALETTIQLPDGTRRVVQVVVYQFKTDKGFMAGSISRDITERKRTEEKLRESEDRYRDLVENSNDLICTHDLEGKLLSVNEAAVRLTGYSRAALLQMNMADLLTPQTRRLFGVYLKKMRTTRQVRGLMQIQTASGETRIWEYDNTLRVEGMAVPLVRGMAHDITERKLAEAALHDSQTQLESIFNSTMDAIITIDEEQKIIIFNPAAEQMFRCPASDVLGQTFDRFLPEYVRKEHREYLRAFGQSNSTKRSMKTPSLALTCLRADGEAFPSEVSISQLNLGGRKLYTAIVRDVTERKQEEGIIQARLRLFEFAPQHSLNELLQKTLDEVCAITNSPIGFYHFVEPDQKTLSLQAWSTRTMQEYCKAEGKGLHYSVDEAGVWVDCIHQRQPVIHNDYVSLPASRRKGLPEGHAALIRELVVPIFREGKIVAILGLGNKAQDYIEKDIDIVTYFADVAWEIAERKRAEDELQEKERLLSEAQRIGNMGSWDFDVASDTLRYSEEMYRIFGISAEKFTHNTEGFLWLIHPEDRGAMGKWIEDILKGTKPGELDFRAVLPDQTIRFIRGKGEAIFDADGRPVRVTGTAQDITERKRAEEEFHNSEKRFRSLIENGRDNISLLATDGTLLWESPSTTSTMGYAPNQFMGRNIFELMHPDDQGWTRDLYAQLIQTPGKSQDGIFRLRHGDGTWRWIESTASNMLDEPSVRAIVINYRDITDHKQAEEQIHYQATLLANVSDAIIATDMQYNILHWNAAAETQYGWPAAEAIGRPMSDFIQNEYVHDSLEEVLQKISEEGHWNGEVTQNRRDGTRFPVLSTVSLVKDHQDKPIGFIAVNRDIIDRKQAEEKLASSEAELRALFVSMHDVVLVIDSQGVYRKIAPTNPSLLYQPPEELLGKSLAEVFPQAEADQFLSDTREVLATGQSKQIEYQLRIGEALYWFLANITPMSEELTVWVAHDITARKQAEAIIQRQLQELTLLHAVAIQAAAAINEEDLLTQTTQLIGQTFYPDNFGFLLLDEAGGRLHPHGSYRGDEASKVEFVRLGEGVTGRVAAEGRSMRIADVRNQKDYINIFPEARSELCVPLRLGERVVGVINAESHNVDAFSEADERLLTIAAGQAATALERIRLFEDTQRRLRQTLALREIDQAIAGSMNLQFVLEIVLKHVITELEVDAALILLNDPREQILKYELGKGLRTNALQFTRLRLGEGYAGQVALGRQTIYIPNLQTRTTDFLRSPTFSQENFVSYFGIPLIAKGEIKGVLEIYHRSLLKPDTKWLDFVEMLAGQIAIAIDNAILYQNLQTSNIELSLAYDATIEGWSYALDLRDKETEGHTLRVTELTKRLAQAIGIGKAELVHIRRGTLLHDIGKMGVPDGILLKPGALTDEEWGVMRRHAQFAFDMLSPIAYLHQALDIPYCHHEKWDGSGYPRGLKGEQIPLAARIFTVVDVWDALISDRPYRKAWPVEQALAHIREQSGKHFDPRMVDIFLRVITEED